MRVELLFDLEKPSLPADNRAIFVSFLKKTLEQSHEGHFLNGILVGRQGRIILFQLYWTNPGMRGRGYSLKLRG